MILLGIALSLSGLLWSQTSAPPPFNTMYLCMNCAGHMMDSMEQFYGAYEQMTVTKKDVLAIGDPFDLVVRKENAFVKKDKERLKFFEEKKIPYAKINEMGDYELLRPHRKHNDSKAQIKNKLVAYLKQLDKSKPVVIHIGGHGWNGGSSGKGTLPPEKAGIALYEPDSPFDTPAKVILTHEELAQLLTQAKLTGPDAPPVRIVAEHCYGGGVHWLAEKFPNVCAASFTSFDEVHWVAERLPERFWRNYNEMKSVGESPNLSDTFMSIFAFRERNEGASLSSTAYVRQVLKKHGVTPQVEDGYQDWESYLRDTSISPAESCEYQGLPASEDFRELENLSREVKTLFRDSDLAGGVWKDHGIDVNPYTEAIEDLARNEGKYQKLMSEYRSRLAELRKVWNSLEEKEKLNSQREWNSSMEDFGTWLMGDLEEDIQTNKKQTARDKEKLLKEFEDFKKKNLSEIVKYLANKDKVRLMKEASAFHRLHKQGKIGMKEVDAYKRMLKCEALPL